MFTEELTAVEETRAAFPLYTRVRRGSRIGTVTDVGELRGEPIVYVTWDRIPTDVPDAPAPREAVLPDQLWAVTS